MWGRWWLPTTPGDVSSLSDVIPPYLSRLCPCQRALWWSKSSVKNPFFNLFCLAVRLAQRVLLSVLSEAVEHCRVAGESCHVRPRLGSREESSEAVLARRLRTKNVRQLSCCDNCRE